MPTASRPRHLRQPFGTAAALLLASGCVAHAAAPHAAAPPAAAPAPAQGTRPAASPPAAANHGSGFSSLKEVAASVRFYEGGTLGQPMEQRAYRTEFAGPQTRLVYWELALRYRPAGQRVDFAIDAEWTDPAGRVIRRQRLDAFARRGTDSAWHSLGFGNAVAGAAWEADGDYGVALLVEGRKIASGTFRNRSAP